MMDSGKYQEQVKEVGRASKSVFERNRGPIMIVAAAALLAYGMNRSRVIHF